MAVVGVVDSPRLDLLRIDEWPDAGEASAFFGALGLGGLIGY